MSNRPKLTGARPLLTLTANNDFAKLEIHGNNAAKAFDLLYKMLCADMTQATVAVVMAVERMRHCNPDLYARYQQQIMKSMDSVGKMN